MVEGSVKEEVVEGSVKEEVKRWKKEGWRKKWRGGIKKCEGRSEEMV